jgi:adenine phosphoribosyltransferase
LKGKVDMTSSDLEAKLRQVPDFPKKGIQFLDFSPMLADPKTFDGVLDLMCAPFKEKKIDKIVAIESRGFILGSAMALKMGVGFVMVRKKGKLPGPLKSVTYALEYGEDQLDIYDGALKPDERVLIVDDVLATGGTAAATYDLCTLLHAKVVGFCFLIEIAFLNGREKLKSDIHSVLKK